MKVQAPMKKNNEGIFFGRVSQGSFSGEAALSETWKHECVSGEG